MWLAILSIIAAFAALTAILWRSEYPGFSKKSLAIGLILLAPFFAWRQYLHCQGKTFSSRLQMVSFLHATRHNTGTAMKRLASVTETRDCKVLPFVPRPDGKEPVFVFVMGESATSEHWHLYGYSRSTTPQMDELAAAGRLAVFQDVISASGNTYSSVPMFFTSMTYDHAPDGIPPGGAETLMKMMHRAGFATVSICSQPNGSARFDSLMRLFGACDKSINLQYEPSCAPRWNDTATLPFFRNELAKRPPGKPFAVFIHLIGSHFPCDDAGCPPSGRVWPEDAIDGTVRHLPPDVRKRINRYDSTIRLTDGVLGEIVRALDAIDAPAAMVYISDHGESPDMGNWHQNVNSRYRVPMIAYFSPLFESAYPEMAERMKRATTSKAQPDQMFWGLVELAGIRTANPADQGKSFLDNDFPCRSPRLVSDGTAAYNPSAAPNTIY